MQQKLFLICSVLLLVQCSVQPGMTLSETERQDVACGQLAIAALHANDHAEAVTRWNQLLQLAKKTDPGGMWHAVSLRNLAELYFANKDFGKAEKNLEAELKILRNIDPEFGDLAYDCLYLGRIAFSRQQFKRANTYLKDGLAIVRKRPSDRSMIPDLLAFAAATAEIRGDHQQSQMYVAELKRVLMDKAASNVFFLCACHLEQSSGKVSGAARKALDALEEELLQESSEASGISGYQHEMHDLYNRMAVYRLGRRRKEAYAMAFRAAVLLERHAPGSTYAMASAYNQAAYIALEAGMVKEADDAWLKALVFYKKLKDHKDEMAMAIAMIAISATLPGNYKRVEEYGLKAVSLKLSEPIRIDLYRCLICAYENLKNEVGRTRYLTILKQTYAGTSSWKKNILRDASSLTAYGAPRSALDLVEYFEKQSGNTDQDSAVSDLRLLIANKFLMTGEEDRGIRAAKGVHNPTYKVLYCSVLHSMGARSLRLGRPKEAQQFFEKELVEIPSKALPQRKLVPLFQLAVSYITDRQYDKAEQVVLTILSMTEKTALPPSIPKFHVYRLQGECSVYKGEERRAIQLMEKMCSSAKASDPTLDWVADINYSYTLLRCKRFSEAERRLRAARDKILKALKNQKQWSKGIWSPAGMWSIAINHYLAICLMEQGRLDQALALLQEPLPANAPTHFWIMFREAVKGRVLSLSGKHSEAQKTFESYLKTISRVDPSQYTNYATALYWQGLDWLAQKQSSKAQHCFERALKLYAPYQQYPYEFRDDCARALQAVRK